MPESRVSFSLGGRFVGTRLVHNESVEAKHRVDGEGTTVT